MLAKTMIRIVVFLAVQICLGQSHCLAQAMEVTYPEPIEQTDHRDDYPIKLLQLIVSHADQDIRLRALKTEANQERNLTLIKQGALDVYWSGASPYREEKLLPIKYPIYKGLLGYRLILIKQQNADLLSKVKELEDLKTFSVGQGSGWPEVKLYLENDFEVHTTTQYPALFEMLEKQRFDIFPRAIIEIWQELDTFSNMNLAIDENILLRYPYAMYFYVNKHNTQLAQQLEIGFNKIIANGEFDHLFEQHIGAYIKRANLSERLVIDLPNPLFENISAKEKALYYRLP